MSAAFLFPGQGAQQPGMLHSLPQHPAVDQCVREVSNALGLDVLLLDSEVSLASSVSVQLALLTAGVATARALIANGVNPIVVAGLSVGSFSAAVIADSISLADAARLVHARATMMESMYPYGYGIAVILGLNELQVSTLVAKSHSEEQPVYVANINAARQIGISGSLSGMRRVLEEALKQGARRAEVLPIAVPSHCILLQPVADHLRMLLNAVEVRDPQIPYVANVNARPVRKAHGIVKDLAENIAHGVRWDEATKVCKELGCESFLEMPPGHTLTDLAKESLPEVLACTVSSVEFVKILKMHLG